MDKLLSKIDSPLGSELKVEDRYVTLSSKRSSFLSSAKEYASLTLPYILPYETSGSRGAGANSQTFSGHGARCVNSLANRLTNNMFPSHHPFFGLSFTETEKEKLKAAGFQPLELTELLTASVRKVHESETHMAGRPALVNAMKSLIITGNCILHSPTNNKDKLRTIPLSHYVVSRDSSDNLLELITLQKNALNTLEEDIKVLVKQARKDKPIKADEDVTIYTYVVRVSRDTFKVVQTAENVLINTSQTVKEDDLPWLVLRWNTCFGEDYGRGYVEDYASDLRVIEVLSEARMKGMVLMGDVKYLVRAGSIIDVDEISQAPTGEWLVGSADDVSVLQLERHADFTPIVHTITEYERRVGQAFLLQAGVRRDAERVTAYELRLDAQELNESLGGIYSNLAVTLQRPYAYLALKLAGFPLGKDGVVPNILTGIEALGQASELDKMRVFTETIGMTNSWSPELLARTDLYTLARKVAASLSFDLDFIRNDEEQAKVAQAQEQQQATMMAGQEAAKAIPKVIENGANNMMGE